jgi:hypothetical protein
VLLFHPGPRTHKSVLLRSLIVVRVSLQSAGPNGSKPVTRDDVACICGSPAFSSLPYPTPHHLSVEPPPTPSPPPRSRRGEACEAAGGASTTSCFFPDGLRHRWEAETATDVYAAGEPYFASHAGWPKKPRGAPFTWCASLAASARHVMETTPVG